MPNVIGITIERRLSNLAQVPIDDNTVKGLLALDDTTSLGIPVKAKTTTGALYVHLDSADFTSSAPFAVQVYDAAGNDLELVKQADNYAAANHGIIAYGVDDGTPQKYRQLRMDTDGRIETHLVNVAHDSIDFNVTDFNTGGGTDNVASFGIAVPASGGAAVVGGAAATGLLVDLGTRLDRTNDAVTTYSAPSDIDITTHTNYAKKYYTSAGAATDGIIWSPAAGKRWHVVTLYLNVSAAATVTLEDDLAAGDSAVWKGELAANSGVVIPFGDKYPLASGEDAADLLITTTAGNVYCTVVGYEV